MSLSNFSVVTKKIVIARAICFSWIIAKVISWKLWLSDRLFPVVPPFNFLFVPSFIHIILFIFSFCGLIALIIFPSKKIVQAGLIIVEVLSCLLDQNRWQPWEYQYIFIIIALVINYKNDKNSVSVITFILIATYFYSGLGKLNVAFSQSIQHRLVRSGIFHVSNSYLYNFLTYHIGYVLGIIELLLCIGLVFKRTKKISAILLIIMHFLIIAAFGPFGLNYDAIIWPWNFVMILILYVIFISRLPVSIEYKILQKGWNIIFVILFGIMPIFNFFGYWDYFLSSSLFSSKTPGLYICISNAGSNKELQPFFVINKNKFLCSENSIIINVRTWSFQELKVPVYPELRVYKDIKSQIVKSYPGSEAKFIALIYTSTGVKRIELK